MDTTSPERRETLHTSDRYLAALAIAGDGRLTSIEPPRPGGSRVTFIITNALPDLEQRLALDQIMLSGRKVLEGLQTVDRVIFGFKKDRQYRNRP